MWVECCVDNLWITFCLEKYNENNQLVYTYSGYWEKRVGQ